LVRLVAAFFMVEDSWVMPPGVVETVWAKRSAVSVEAAWDLV
jgi:hypothetical protein